MKNIIINKYYFYRPEIVEHLKNDKGFALRNNEAVMMIDSDNQISTKKQFSLYNKYKSIIKEEHPNFYIHLGDFSETTDYNERDGVRDYITSYIIDNSNNSDIGIIILGNHEYFALSSDKKEKFDITKGLDLELINKIRNNKNTIFLQNSSYDNSSFHITGLDLGPEYYINGEHIEDINKLLEQNPDIIKKDPNKYNILLVHSPKHIIDSKYDLQLSGHMHNGLVPENINSIIPTTYGIITPDMSIFPKTKNCRRETKVNNTDIIIKGAGTTLSECNGTLSKFDFLYPAYLDEIIFTGNKEYKGKKNYVKRREIITK